MALPPPPGSEQVQFRLLETWGIGRAAATIDEMASILHQLLTDRARLEAFRTAAARRKPGDAAGQIARWILDRVPERGQGGLAVGRTA